MSTPNSGQSSRTNTSSNGDLSLSRRASSHFLGDHPNLQATGPAISSATATTLTPPSLTISAPSPSTTTPTHAQAHTHPNTHTQHAQASGSGSAPVTLGVASGAAAAAAMSSRSLSSDQIRNIELNSHTSPAVPSQSHRYPAMPRFSPAIPTRMSGADRSSYTNGYVYPRSASNSPPGTPPNGLRSVYLNAAFQRSQHNMHLPGAGRSSSASPRPPQLQLPISSSTTVQPPPPILTRSYSAGHLGVDEPEIMVTSPGGTNEIHSTQEHVMRLDRALSNLIESQEQVEDETDGPLTMKNKKSKGISKFPKIVHDRLGSEKVAAVASGSGISSNNGGGSGSHSSTTNNSANNTPPPEIHRTISDLTLEAERERYFAERETIHPLQAQQQQPQQQQQQQQQQDSTKKKSGNRMSRLFGRDQVAAAYLASASAGQTHDTSLTHDPTFRPQYLSRQPTKGGVLSNLLKLQAGTQRHHKNHVQKEHKEKKKEKTKRQVIYPLSANSSMHNILSTYPPLPSTVGNGQAAAIATGMQSNSPNGTAKSRNNIQRHSLQFDPSSSFAFPSFPATAPHSPMQSPNGSPRGSFSGDMTPTTYMGSIMGSETLTPEEKIKITYAVADTLERQDYILRLARAMIRYGAPSHRLEDAIDSSARALEINLQCVYLPNIMVIAFTDYETHTSETHLLKVAAGLDMFKFAQVHQILKMVTHSVMGVEEGIMKLEAINSERDIHPRWMTILAYATASFCTASMFFQGGWIDAGVALLMGTAVGLMTWLSEKLPSYSNICEVTMSLLVAFIAEALHDYVCRSAVKMAGIVMLLPGYTITVAILELSSRHMISGSVRLFYAVIFSLLLGYGLTIGASLWQFIRPVSTGDVVDPTLTSACPTTLDPKWNILFVPLFAISLNIWLKAHPRQWPLACVLSIIGWTVSWSSATYGGAPSEVSSALASFAIGFFGNIYQRLTHQLTFQAVVCAVFFLVPGSLGLKGSMALFTEDMVGGANFALEMVTTAIAISVGLFCASFVVYPLGKTRSAQMTF
ncbi:hypothetical protein DFQ27_003176 [Actinomortierella ambigua]|uniref:Threonine/serine exporter-like N-terminal domain-containing protein n=1 Tax=Actinomortierella ambigua TaxID=1343610 RepID=A0A9P6Q9S0_9FUNG|nr:hypothetical protein DFQ27_003176 [Actinomortierella ambigua]